MGIRKLYPELKKPALISRLRRIIAEDERIFGIACFLAVCKLDLIAICLRIKGNVLRIVHINVQPKIPLLFRIVNSRTP